MGGKRKAHPMAPLPADYHEVVGHLHSHVKPGSQVYGAINAYKEERKQEAEKKREIQQAFLALLHDRMITRQGERF